MSLKLTGRTCLLIACLMIGAFSATSDAQELLRLRYGVTTSLQHLPIWVGKENGLFAKYGFDLEPIHVRGDARGSFNRQFFLPIIVRCQQPDVSKDKSGSGGALPQSLY